jgi:hypothetical protein
MSGTFAESSELSAKFSESYSSPVLKVRKQALSAKFAESSFAGMNPG